MKAPARATAALTIALLPVTAVLALHFRDGPPARVTGGFGEDSCVACHFGNELNEGAGRLTLAGLPERFEPGATYALEIALTRPGMSAAGFQLAVRDSEDRTQAGGVTISDDKRVAILDERGMQFVQHRLVAAPTTGEDTVRWQIAWTAPESVGRVTRTPRPSRVTAMIRRRGTTFTRWSSQARSDSFLDFNPSCMGSRLVLKLEEGYQCR